MEGSRKIKMLESIGSQDVERMMQSRVKPGAEIHAHFSASTVENETVVTLDGHLTGHPMRDYVVESILVFSGDTVFADQEHGIQAFDIFFSGAKG